MFNKCIFRGFSLMGALMSLYQSNIYTYVQKIWYHLSNGQCTDWEN